MEARKGSSGCVEKNICKCQKILDLKKVSYKMIVFSEKHWETNRFEFLFVSYQHHPFSNFLVWQFGESWKLRDHGPWCREFSWIFTEEQREQRFTNSVHQIVRQGGKCGDPETGGSCLAPSEDKLGYCCLKIGHQHVQSGSIRKV